MLDVRVYRAAFLPALVALFVAAFSLADRPAPLSSPLAADAFRGDRAFGGRAPLRNSLTELGRSFPERLPGSADDAALSDRVADTLGAADRTGRPSFDVTRERTGEIETVIGVRPGLSSRADRGRLAPRRGRQPGARRAVGHGGDARARAAVPRARPAAHAGARVHLGRDARLHGRAGVGRGRRRGERRRRARARRPRGRARSPSRGWRRGRSAQARRRSASQRTVEQALRAEAGPPGGSRATAQWARRALPFTVSEQGVIAEAGLPAVLIGVSGERGPAAARPRARRRASSASAAPSLRTVTAIDAAPAERGVRRRPAGHRHDAQRAARLGGAPARRHAAAARVPHRARRLLPRAPPASRGRRRGSRGWPSRARRSCSPGGGRARSGSQARSR